MKKAHPPATSTSSTTSKCAASITRSAASERVTLKLSSGSRGPLALLRPNRAVTGGSGLWSGTENRSLWSRLGKWSEARLNRDRQGAALIAVFLAAAALAFAVKPVPKPKPLPLTPEQKAAQALLKPLSLHDRV